MPPQNIERLTHSISCDTAAYWIDLGGERMHLLAETGPCYQPCQIFHFKHQWRWFVPVSQSSPKAEQLRLLTEGAKSHASVKVARLQCRPYSTLSG
jgi:hypothetical protein